MFPNTASPVMYARWWKKPNETIPVAPLKPIPACREPFTEIIIDCVGPLPKTKSGNQKPTYYHVQSHTIPRGFSSSQY